jgi:hypothetical protein
MTASCAALPNRALTSGTSRHLRGGANRILEEATLPFSESVTRLQLHTR